MDNCTCCCYDDFISDCVDEFSIYANLTPEETYKVILRNKFDQLYAQQVTAGADGELTIDTTVFPQHMLNIYAGTFNITVEDGDCNEVQMVIGEKEYTCVELSIKKTTDLKNAIPCQPE